MYLARHFKLGETPATDVRHFVSDRVDARLLAAGKKTITVTVTRTGKFYDPRYGDFEITNDMLLSMVRNFRDEVFGQEIVLDVAHRHYEGAAGFFRELFVEKGKLRGKVELTEYGIESIKKRGFIYLSAEFRDNFIDNESRKEHGPTLLGAALTPRPVIKRMDPIQLSEEGLSTVPTYLSDRVANLLSNDMEINMKELLKKLHEKLTAMKLAEAIVTKLTESFEAVAKNLAEEDLQRAVMTEFVSQGEVIAKQLAEQSQAGGEFKLDFSGLEKVLSESQQSHHGMTEDDVKKLMQKSRDDAASASKKLTESLEANVNMFNKLLGESDGFKTLSEDQQKKLSAASDLITSEMTADHIKKLADHQLTVANDIAIATKLNGMGYSPSGNVHISVDESNTIKQLNEEIRKGLLSTSVHSTGKLKLSEKVLPFIDIVLAEFDAQNAPRLHHEAKMLASGSTAIADTNLPVGFQRTVIREALSDLRVLELIQTLTDFSATGTTQIPYETRDDSAVMNNGIVYEGAPIHRASVTQAMDMAYILPMKLAFLISNEVIHFSRASQIDWDAYARNVESNARIMRELITRRICNELQRAADAYGAVAVTGEAFDTQLDGATSTMKTTNYPIVRPHQQKDMTGTNVGSEENPIAMVLNGVTLSEYDGSGTQTAGTYYRVTNYNLGYIQLVDESGTPVTPADTGTNTLGYSYATNVAKFDLDNGTTEIGLHLNGLLRTFGSRKAVMAQDRFIKPDFMLMSYTLNNSATNANNFEADSKRNGTDTTMQGDLDTVKGIPAFSTNAPSVDLGDERAIVGERGTMTYTIAKPFMTGQPVEAVDSNGNLIGKKQAYGEEYSAIKVPTPIRKNLTSVLAYSYSGR